MMTASGIAIFFEYYKVKPVSTLYFMIVEIPSICESLLISINDTSIYLGVYARNESNFWRLLGPTEPPPQSTIKSFRISL